MTLAFRFLPMLFAACITSNSCSQTPSTHNASGADVFTGSTPCDATIQALLKLPPVPTCDFIRWQLTLDKSAPGSRTFQLRLVYGEGQPNTLGFKGGGTTRLYAGKYNISKWENDVLQGERLQLTASEPRVSLSLVKMNEDIYHLLTPGQTLMIGNSGWSYTLNRKTSALPPSGQGLHLTIAPSLFTDTARQVVFEGRTACQEFARQYGRNAGSDCLKLKWLLTLNRDPVTHAPTTYHLAWTLSRRQAMEGKWTTLKGLGQSATAVVYQLDPDQPDRTIYLLVGDRNTLFFLDKEGRLLKGDENFSYTLNRVQ